MDEEGEHDIELIEAGEYASIAFQAAEKPLDLVARSVQSLAVSPWLTPVLLGWDNRMHIEIEHQLARIVALVGTIHDHMVGGGWLGLQQLTPGRGVARLAGRERKAHG